MSKGVSFQSPRGCVPLAALGWVLLAVGGIALVWVGFFRAPKAAEVPTATQTPTAAVAAPTPTSSPMPSPSALPTQVPLPTSTPLPTAMPPTPTATALMEAGVDGANVRSGPGVNFARIGYLDPGAQAPVTGRYTDWWQIAFENGQGWVYGGIVTTTNTDNVTEVQPPASPIPPTPAPTAIPTETPVLEAATPEPPPGPPAEFRGLVPNSFTVEGAPGPFAPKEKIWTNMDVANATDQQIDYSVLGPWVQETGHHKTSWTDRDFKPYQHEPFNPWRDWISIDDTGTYNLWMRICFQDGQCVNLAGPVVVQVE